jgi:polar amino acid transport system substrate-binding protein
MPPPVLPPVLRYLRLGLIAICLGAGPAAFAAPPAADRMVSLCFERQEVLPWRTLDGGGLNFELLGDVARRTGVVFDYQSMPWKRCLEQVKANQVDGAFAVSFSRERLEVGAYPGVHGDDGRADPGRADPGRADPGRADPDKRMHVDRYVLVRRKGSRVDWDGKHFANVDGRIGFQLGYSVGDFLRAQNVPVDEGSQQADELVQKLLAGRLVAAALGGGDAVRVMRTPVAQQIEVLPTPLVEKPYYLILSHAFVAQQPELAARIWKAIEEVRTSPAYRRRERELTGQPGGGH